MACERRSTWRAVVRPSSTALPAPATARPTSRQRHGRAFEREANPYRSGGARLSMAVLAPLLTVGENEVVVQLG